MLDSICIKPLYPLLKIFAIAHAPCDRIPAALCLGSLGIVPNLYNEFSRFVDEHLRKELVLGCEMVVLGCMDEREDLGVEFKRSFE